MLDSVTAEKQQPLDRLTAYICEHHAPEDADALVRLARDYYRDHTTELLQRDPTDLYRPLADCWRLLRRRQPAGQDPDWEAGLEEDADAYRGAFPSAYREHFSPRQAREDIARIEALSGDTDLGAGFATPSAADSRLHFKLVTGSDSLVLSDVVPTLENLGMQVIGEHPYRVRRGDGATFWIHDFTLIPADTSASTLAESTLALFREAFLRTWRGEAENDEFNRLVTRAGLDWRSAALLRAYARYIRQTKYGFSQPFIAEALCRQVTLSRLLVALFHARFDPERALMEQACDAVEAEINAALEQVESLDDDKILRRLLELVLATLRTNYFQPAKDGQPKHYFAFKLNPEAISELPKPRPRYEIFVYSPRVEGVHLRTGKVARGGLRWSDRMEDYRTEVLGLVKAQQVKNSVIVPMGAKGCFIAKRLPTGANREQIQAEGVACYRTYIRGLLDLTDNLVDGQVCPPPSLVRHDDDDPYLVVAADKGTATFSDIANAIAAEYGFWLGDAFASGGSQGYDHKGMGITARGAWESVKRHFRERGLDTQRDPFTVVGIGDMSGDVFGNGMLLSPSLELVAAFNHQHIFIDPNPNAEAACAERQRLFALPRSGWSDYRVELISNGGGVFSRNAKWIPVSAEMRERFGIDAERLAPDDLIAALLRAPVDMLWNGGIGTYVKSRRESHADVGDKANDAVRVDADTLRCKVLGEGGNLGFTQLGRIEFSLGGGACNSDFIDNAGGVDCSDHEVNIKILLNEQVAQGRLSVDERNALLREMTAEVAELVLRNNYRQAQALSIAEHHARENLDEYIRLIDHLERIGRLDRELECLPDRKTLLERREAGAGLTRPELSVLISYAKIELKQALINSWITEDPALSRELESAFPARLRQAYPEAIGAHRLRREIAATQIANDLVNRMGITYLHHLRQATGADHAQIAAAYLVAREVYGIDRRWREIEALDGRVPAAIQAEMMKGLVQLLTRASWWLLRRRRNALGLEDCIASYRAGIEATVATTERLQATIPAADRWHARHQTYTDAGVPELLSAYCAASDGLYWLLDIIEAATELELELVTVSPLYFELGERLSLPWLDRQIRTFRAANHWQTLARNGYRDDLDAQQRALTISALRGSAEGLAPQDALSAWLENHRGFIDRWQSLLADMQSSRAADCALFTVAINVLFELT